MWVFYCAVAALFFWSFSFPTSAVLNTQSIFPTFSVLQVALVGITRRLEVRNRTVRISIKLTLVLVHYFHTVQIIFTQNFSFSCIIYLSHTKILFQLTHMLWVTSPFCFASPIQSKALIPLQTEAHPETKQRVLTNYMFPQQPRSDEGKTSSAVPTQAGAVLVQVVEIKEREGFQMWFFVWVSLFWHVKSAVHT